MSDFVFESAASPQDADAVLRGLALERGTAQPVFGARLDHAGGVPKIVFASRAVLALFGAANLDALGKRLFSAGDPGAKRLAGLMQKAATDSAPRLERLRFYLGLTTQIFTFACRWVSRADQKPLFAATILDAPADLLSWESVNADPVVAPPESASSAPRPSDAKAVRFLWRTDTEHRFTEITPPLARIVGPASADLIGRTIQEVADKVQGPRAELMRAFAKRETWSGIEVLWPIDGTANGVPVGLGALPSFDRDKHFEGFHGFGVIYADRIAPFVADAPAPDAAPAPAETTDAMWPPAYDGENVVVFRAFAAASKAPGPEINVETSPADLHAAVAAGSDTESGRDLSPAEEIAFHEIARALTADESAKAAHDALGAEVPDTSANSGQNDAEPDPDVKPAADLPHPALAAPEMPLLLAGPSAADAASPAPEPPLSESPKAVPLTAATEMEELTRNAAAIFSHLNAGVLVSRNEEPVFANRYLLDLLGYENLSVFQAEGGIPRLLSQPAASGSTTVELTTRQGHLIAMIAREQCVDWDHLPATLIILQPTEASEIHATKDARLAHYEAESHELNAILDTATDGVAVLDATGRIMTLNRSGEALFGYDQNEVIGEPFSVLFDAESRAVAEDYLEGLKTHSVKSLLNDGREITGRARQGGLIPIFITLGRVSSSHTEDKDLKFCALLRDMTHWKKVEQELEEARKGAERASALKSDFLAKVSHEIRTPLNAILGFAEVIMEERFGAIGNERYKDYLKDIHMSGAHVMSLVNDLLDLSKIEAGKLELDFHEVDANHIITECVALMQPQANRERVIMRMSLASTLPQISADERSLRQIILNLLSNAVKFNEPGGQVIVATASSDAGHAVIRIRDTGIGMSEQDIETALEPFRQVATPRQTTGTGLGLPLTKALVEANHAYFSIKSKKQEGTLVEVTFPVMRVSA